MILSKICTLHAATAYIPLGRPSDVPNGRCPFGGSRCIQDCTAKVFSTVNLVEQIKEILKVI